MAVDKEAMLAAIAQAGTAGKQAYEQAQAAMAAQQAEAIRMALASGVAQNSNMGAQAEIQRIVSQPYQTRAAQLTSNEAAMTDWFNRTGVNARQWGDVMAGLTEAVAARAAAEGGGGGGGSGGGGGGGEDTFDWYENLKDTFGTADLGWDAIAGEAKSLGLNSIQNPDQPRYLQTRDYATNAYGVPPEIAAGKFLPSEFAFSGDDEAPGVMESATTVGNRRQFKQFKKDVKRVGRSTPGNQSYWVRQSINTAKGKIKPKPKRKPGGR